jgi:hypothetical protein
MASVRRSTKTGGGIAANHWRVRVADDVKSILERPL